MNYTENLNLKLLGYDDLVSIQDLNDNFRVIDAQMVAGDSTIMSKAYPVGSMFLSVANISPSVLFGGVWEQVSEGLVLRTTANDNTNEIIGVDSIQVDHAHTVNSHSHSNASHTHTSAAHTHTIASHTHTGVSHSHTIGGTTLTTSQMPSHNHSMASGGSHTHTAQGYDGVWGGGTQNVFEWWSNGTTAKYVTTSSAGSHTHTVYSTGGGGSHTHSCPSVSTGTTGGTSLTTNSTTPGSTGGSGTWNTGNSAPGTSSALISSKSIIPHSLTVYMWVRTA